MRSAAGIIAELTTQLAAVKLADDTTPAFQRIERFDVESLTEAFRLLLISEQRVCVIVALDEQYESVLENRKLLVKRLQPIVLLISDRVLGDRDKALWGDPEDASNPGAYALAALALPAVTGQLLAAAPGLGAVVSAPASASPIFLQDDDQQNLPGRAAVALELHCRGGTLTAPLQAGSNL